MRFIDINILICSGFTHDLKISALKISLTFQGVENPYILRLQVLENQNCVVENKEINEKYICPEKYMTRLTVKSAKMPADQERKNIIHMCAHNYLFATTASLMLMLMVIQLLPN